MRCTRYLFFIVSFCCVFVSCRQNNTYQPGVPVYIYEDSTASITASEALRFYTENKFGEFNSGDLNAGYTQSIFWIAFNMDSFPAPGIPHFLHIGNSHINIIKVYQVINNLPVHLYTTGDYYPFTQRPVSTTDFNFPLKGPGTYLAMIDKHNESLQLQVSIDVANKILDNDKGEKLILSFLTGMIALMVIFGLYLFPITRQRIYLFYIGFMVCGWLWVLANLGLGMQYLWPAATGFASKARLIFSLLGLFFSMHFMVLFTGGIHKTIPRKIFNVLSLVLLILVALILFGSYDFNQTPIWLYFQFIIPTAILSFVLLALGILIYKTWKGDRNALFFLFSIIVLALAGATESIYHTGRLQNVEIKHIRMAMPTGFVLQLIILTAGLVYRFNQFRLEKERLLAEINRRQVENTNALIHAQEAERSQVADQLHDVAGSVLSAARLNLSAIMEEHKLNNLPTDERIVKTEEAVTAISDTIRNLSHALSPVMLDKVGFKTSLEKIISIFNASGKINIQLISLGFDKYVPALTPYYNVLYSIIYEALNNIVRHSKATHAIVQVIDHEESFAILIEDNGVGLHEEDLNNKQTFGLHGIKLKVALYNGQVAFDKNTPSGLVITIEIPKKYDIQNRIG